MKLECRAVMIFFHYCVLSNYFWLFIEGLYLFTLLVETFFPERRYFYWYIIIGWGKTLNASHSLLDSWFMDMVTSSTMCKDLMHIQLVQMHKLYIFIYEGEFGFSLMQTFK